jgi:hypothetical protein
VMFIATIVLSLLFILSSFAALFLIGR